MTVAAFATGLVTHNLTLSRSGRRIANDISISLAPGTITILRGANGSGKTTLLRALAGLLSPTAGSISFTSDSDPTTTTETQRASCVFFGHANAVKGPLSIIDNLKFWAKLYGADQAQIDLALNAFDLMTLADRHADTLSAGQRRRVGFCRVLISGKPVWLLDEPTASMDATSIAQFRQAVINHQNSGGSILIATHDPLSFDGAENLELSARGAAL